MKQNLLNKMENKRNVCLTTMTERNTQTKKNRYINICFLCYIYLLFYH